MQRCTATVRLGGDLKNTVVRYGLSPAEVLVLRQIHGDDAVVDFKPEGNDRGKSVNEKARLENIYGRKFREAFPGANPQLPEKLRDIGVDLYAEDEEAPKPRRNSILRGKTQPFVGGIPVDENGVVQEVTAADLSDDAE